MIKFEIGNHKSSLKLTFESEPMFALMMFFKLLNYI